MKILICVSRVPDTTARISIEEDGKTISETGVKYIVNPYDEFALETGIRLKEQHGGECIAITVGIEKSQDVLRTALAMGCDNAILVKGNENQDSFSVAENIAAVARDISPDIIVLGRQSIDFDSMQMQSLLGAMLDMPSVSVASSLDVDGDWATCLCDIEGGKETVKTPLPCIISTQKGIYEPRYPKLPQIMKAKKKPLEVRDSVSTGNRTEVLSMEIPKTSRVGKILSDSDSDIAEIVRSLAEDAKVI